jgi:hypothetical protein
MRMQVSTPKNATGSSNTNNPSTHCHFRGSLHSFAHEALRKQSRWARIREKEEEGNDTREPLVSRRRS